MSEISGTDAKGQLGNRVAPFSFSNFQGIDRSRDIAAMDTGEQQHLWDINNGYVDWRGIIIRDAALRQRARDQTQAIIRHVTFFGRDLAVWAEQLNGGISLRSERGAFVDLVFPVNRPVNSASFNSRNIFFSRDSEPRRFNGVTFDKLASPGVVETPPSFGCAIQRRFAVAGMRAKPTEVWLSRVDNEDRMPPDEPLGDTTVTRAGIIDVKNLINTQDRVTGLGQFERNRLAIFTEDQALVYRVDPDLTQWTIDERANLRIGCISHATIAVAGVDLMFCARDGVYSMRRSIDNGFSIYAMPMTEKIQTYYRELVRSVSDPETISAYFNQDTGQYNIYFPKNQLISERLTASIAPSSDRAREGETRFGGIKWTRGSYLNQTCGAMLGGVNLIGTTGGLYEQTYVEDKLPVQQPLEVVTPILWNGGINTKKQSHAIVIQASGFGDLTVEAFDQDGRKLSTFTIQVENERNDGTFPAQPMARQYERPFQHSYKGVQLRFTSKGTGLLRLIGFAIYVHGAPQQQGK